MNNWLRNLCLGCASLSLYACSGVNFSEWHFPYMMQVQQGNYITSDQVTQLQVGMTKEQVVFIIGHPLTQFIFDQNRWDFIYQNYQNNKLSKSYAVTLYFDQAGKVTNIAKVGEFFTK